MPRKKAPTKPKQPRQGGNNGGGRRKKWDELNMINRLDIVEGWARNGAIDKEIYEALGVSRDVFYEWKKQYPEFAAAVSRGKDIADLQVEAALFKRALGYQFEEVTREMLPVVKGGMLVRDEDGNPVVELQTVKSVTKQQAPDTTAQIFWLKNRKPEQWRDKQEIKHTGGLVTIVNDLPPDEATDGAE